MSEPQELLRASEPSDGAERQDPREVRNEKAPRIRWPRGRYNGMRIVGVEVRIRVDVTWWSLALPSFRYGTCLSFGPLHVWMTGAYR